MKRKQDLPRVRHLRAMHAAALNDVMAKGSSIGSLLDSLLDDVLTGGSYSSQEWTSSPAPTSPRELRAFGRALAMDPTPKAIYLTTIIRWLLDKTVRFEDGRRVRTVLARFHATKPRLAQKDRDVGIYYTLGDLEEMLEGEGEVLPIQVPAAILSKTPAVATGNDWAVFTIRTTDAASWWADSTSWCTRHPRTAEDYLNDGPLHVLLHGRHKYQLHVARGQLMDAKDRAIRELPKEMPVEAFEALWRVGGAENDPLLFRKPSLLDAMAGMLEKADGRCRSACEFRIQPSASSSDWVAPDGSCYVKSKKDGSLEVSEIVDGRIERRTIAAADIWSAFDNPRSVASRMLDSGAARYLGGSTAPHSDLWVRIDGTSEEPKKNPNEIKALFHGMVPTIRFDADGRLDMLYCIDVEDRTGEGEWSCYCSLIDFKATQPEQRLLQIRGPEDLRKANDRQRRAISDVLKTAIGYGGFETFGRDGVIEIEGDEWRTTSLRDCVVHGLVTHTWSNGSPVWVFDSDTKGKNLLMSSHLEEMASVVLEDVDHATLWRMSKSISIDLADRMAGGSWLHARDGAIPGAAKALLSIKDIPRAGHLLAAIPDDECTEDLVDELMDAGRMEVIAVMPARLLTEQRLRRVVDSGFDTKSIVGMAPRALAAETHRLLKPLRDIGQLTSRHSQYFRDKGIYTLRRLINSSDTLKSSLKNLVLPAVLGENEINDRVLPRLLQSSEATAILDHAFLHVPPAGLPWVLALRALRRSPEGMEDAMRSLMDGEWNASKEAPSPPSILERLSLLMEIEGAADAFARIGASLSPLREGA